jgi:hypothetical protein
MVSCKNSCPQNHQPCLHSERATDGQPRFQISVSKASSCFPCFLLTVCAGGHIHQISGSEDEDPAKVETAHSRQTIAWILAIVTMSAVTLAYFSLRVLPHQSLARVLNESACRLPPPPPPQPPARDASAYAFDPRRPPLARDGFAGVNHTEPVVWGAAALHVCSRGTSEQSFLRRDDCDGCLCPMGSVWVHYKDPRFFGDGRFCVPAAQWRDCVSQWACCAHKPNFCWDFIYGGARQDPTQEEYKVRRHRRRRRRRA